jgi:ribosomal protein L40E
MEGERNWKENPASAGCWKPTGDAPAAGKHPANVWSTPIFQKKVDPFGTKLAIKTTRPGVSTAGKPDESMAEYSGERSHCPHCRARIPVREHRCTHCGQDVVRPFWPAIWGVGLVFGFLLFCAALFLGTILLKP